MKEEKDIFCILEGDEQIGVHIQNNKYWEVNFLTSIFQVGNSQKNYQK